MAFGRIDFRVPVGVDKGDIKRTGANTDQTGGTLIAVDPDNSRAKIYFIPGEQQLGSRGNSLGLGNAFPDGLRTVGCPGHIKSRYRQVDAAAA